MTTHTHHNHNSQQSQQFKFKIQKGLPACFTIQNSKFKEFPAYNMTSDQTGDVTHHKQGITVDFNLDWV